MCLAAAPCGAELKNGVRIARIAVAQMSRAVARERRPPGDRQEDEPQRPGDGAAAHPTTGSARSFESLVSMRCMVEVTSL